MGKRASNPGPGFRKRHSAGRECARRAAVERARERAANKRKREPEPRLI